MMGDVTSLRPTEVLFEEWSLLRQQKIPTPRIAVWPILPTGANIWQNFLDLYNNESYADLVMVDAKTGKKMMFSTLNPDPSIVAAIESNGGRNDVILQEMWGGNIYDEGYWTFESSCLINGQTGGTTVVGAECKTGITTNSKFGSQMSVSPSWQVSYGCLPGASPGKLKGLSFQTLFDNVLAAQPDYLFMSSFNEWCSQPQPNPWTAIPLAFGQGLPNDPNKTSLWVDIYAAEFGRDIEPSKQYGSYIYDIMASCVKLYKSGATTCNVATEVCCQKSNYFTNIWSLQSTAQLGYQDFVLSNNETEFLSLVKSGDYVQICNPFSGPTVFCVNMLQGTQWASPFMVFNENYGGGLTSLYRCLVGARHFFSTDSHCEGCTVDGLLGYLSPTRSGTTLRGLYRCYSRTTLAHYHSVDLSCPPTDFDTNVLGYVH